jgi:hypothetical protein
MTPAPITPEDERMANDFMRGGVTLAQLIANARREGREAMRAEAIEKMSADIVEAVQQAPAACENLVESLADRWFRIVRSIP